MSFICRICGLDLDIEPDGIPVIGITPEEKHARWIDYAGRHMATLHRKVMEEIVTVSSMISYLILTANIKTDDQTVFNSRLMAIDKVELAMAQVEAIHREPPSADSIPVSAIEWAKVSGQ